MLSKSPVQKKTLRHKHTTFEENGPDTTGSARFIDNRPKNNRPLIKAIQSGGTATKHSALQQAMQHIPAPQAFPVQRHALRKDWQPNKKHANASYVSPEYNDLSTVIQRQTAEEIEREAEEATTILLSSPVLNMTKLPYYLLSDDNTDLHEEVIAHRGLKKIQDVKKHLVNKWERAEDGEAYLPDYVYNDPGNEISPGTRTNDAEATQLGINATDYGALESWQKMQFALIAVGNVNTGFGKSAFKIKQEKVNQGFIHFGDSGVYQFNKRIRYTDREEIKDYLKTADTFRKNIIKHDLPQWIEVNLPDGVRIPEDIDKIIVARSEFNTIVEVAVDYEIRSKKMFSKMLNKSLYKSYKEWEIKKLLKKWSGNKYKIVTSVDDWVRKSML